MSDDLVKQARHNALADMPHYASVELIEALADRIEKLETLLWAAEYDAKEAEADAEELEAKLAKAVGLVESAFNEGFGEGMNDFTRSSGGKTWYDSRSRKRLAELTGGKDE